MRRGPNGKWVMTSEVEYFRLCQIKGAVHLEMAGMRHSSGKSATAEAKRRYGLKGNRQKVYEALCEMVQAAKLVDRPEGEVNG